MKRVTIIGSGNAFNTDGRAHACYLLENSAGESMLLDVGATSLQRLQESGVDLQRIGFVLLTHFHGDHLAGLPFVLLQMDLVDRRTDPLVIAGPPGIQHACESIVDVCYPDFRFRFPIEYRELDARPATGAAKGAVHGRDGHFGCFRVTPYPITHRPESTGYRVRGPASRSFAFSGDALFDERLCGLVDGVDVAVVELSMAEQGDPPVAHVALSEVRQRGDLLQARRLIFSHITDDLARQVVAENLGEAAHDGFVIEF